VPDTSAAVAAVILAGGRSSRFGSDKLHVEVHGHELLDGVVSAAFAVAGQVVVVGPLDLAVAPGVLVTREEPEHAGPFAAVARGLELVDTDVVLVLAGDLVDPAPAFRPLLDALATDPHADAAVIVDSTGHVQPLLAAYRTLALRGCIVGVDPVGRAAWALLDGLHVHEVIDADRWSRDIDSPDDLARESDG
jgi:molybdopterin-guanine dinucleotide biosynthesis protein A